MDRLAESVRTAHARGFTEDDERLLEPDEASAMLARHSRARRLLHATLRGDPPVPPGPRPGPGGGGQRGADLRADPGAVDRARTGRDRRGDGARRGGAASDRGLHGPDRRTASDRGPGLLPDGRDRAPVRVHVGVHRPGGPALVLRRAPPDHLRAADGRRAAGVRRSRSAVPLRLADPSVVRRSATGLPGPPHRAPRDAARSSRTSSSPTSGADAWASPATGSPRSGWTGAPGLGWAGGYVGDGVATTNLAGRTLTDLVTGADSDLVTFPGSATGAVSGSRSRCAGSASTPACARRPWPTSRSGGPVGRAGWRD